jgi:hypothetical protein
VRWSSAWELVNRNNESSASQRGPEPWNTEAEEATTLEAVTRQRLVKTQQTEDTPYCRVCELAIAV